MMTHYFATDKKNGHMFLACLVMPLLVSLTACSGIPVRSLPKLYSLQSQILEIQPNDLMVAIQMDERWPPPR
jgi:hypothetical protein